MATEGDGMVQKIILPVALIFVLYSQMVELPNAGFLPRKQWDRSRKDFEFAGNVFLEFAWKI
jgi:hypothetical protein